MQIVKGDGPLDAKIAFIGEAPGEEEIAQGKPFVGTSGRYLMKMMAQAGIVRDACYVTNVVKERPPQNDISHFITFPDKAGKAVKTTPEYDLYETALIGELNSCTANVLVPVGRVGLYAICRQYSINSYRGSILAARPELGGRKAVPIIHPAAALRQFIYSYSIAHDLKRVAVQSEFPELRLPKRSFLLGPDLSTVCAFLERILERKGTVAFDIEVINLQISCISFSAEPFNENISIPFYWAKGDYWTPPEEESIWRLIAAILSDEGIKKVAHNAVFDTGFIYDRYGIVTRNLEDTMVAHGLLYPDMPKKLEFATSTLTEEPYYKSDRKAHAIKELNNENFWRYNARDSAVTLEIWPKLMFMLDGQENRHYYELKRKLLPVLVFMGNKGIRVDVEGIRAEATRLDAEVDELKARLKDTMGDVNVRSPKQLLEYFSSQGHPTYRSKGRPTVDKKALKRLAIRGSEEAVIIGEIRKKEKLSGTYLKMRFDKDGRMRTSFNPVGTVSGRLSSSKTIEGLGSNIQNLPKFFKKFVLADPGYVMVEMDLSQAENRIVAYCAPEPTMRRTFEEGKDVHRLTYGLMFGKRMEDVSDEPGSCELGDGSMSERAWGKRFNHALNYGIGYVKFSLDTGLNQKQARWCIDRYHQIYPNVRNGYQKMLQMQVLANRTTTNPYGRKRVFLGRLTDEQSRNDLFRQVFGDFPQSTVAYKIDGALVRIYNEMHDVELLDQIHDSILFQLPVTLGAQRIVEYLLRIKEILEEPVPWTTPFVIPADIKLGTSWGRLTELHRGNCESMLLQVEDIISGLVGTVS